MTMNSGLGVTVDGNSIDGGTKARIHSHIEFSAEL